MDMIKNNGNKKLSRKSKRRRERIASMNSRNYVLFNKIKQAK